MRSDQFQSIRTFADPQVRHLGMAQPVEDGGGAADLLVRGRRSRCRRRNPKLCAAQEPRQNRLTFRPRQVGDSAEIEAIALQRRDLRETTKLETTKNDRREGERASAGLISSTSPEKRNAVSVEMWAAIPAIVEDFVADDDVRVIVMKGAGDKALLRVPIFPNSARSGNSPEATKYYDAVSADAHTALVKSPMLVIAMINGFVSAAVSLWRCRQISGSRPTTRALRFLRRGWAWRTGGGLDRLIGIVGPSFAKEIFFTAQQFSHDEALAMGLVNRVVPAAELNATSSIMPARSRTTHR